MPISSFPQELLDRILDYCHPDKKTLERCSRVCKAWSPASRNRLFCSLTTRYRYFSTWLPMLESEAFSAELRLSVKHLELDVKEDLHDFAFAIPKLSYHLAPRSLRISMDNQTEDEDTFDWEFHEKHLRVRQDQTLLLGCFPTIVSLDLSITCDTFLEVIELVTSFPLLEELNVRGEWKQESEVMPPFDSDKPLLLPKNIRSLSLLPGEPFFLEWLIQHRPLLTPSSLDLWVDYNMPAHGQLIRQAGSSLTHLKIISGALLSEDITLAENVNLRSLHLRVWDNAVGILLRLLSQIPGRSTAVEDLEFQAWEAGSDDGTCVGLWEELDQLLTGPRFDKLRNVTVRVLKTHSAAVRERPPRLNLLRLLWLRDQSGRLLN
ncbi:hypothetical protein DXG01_010614 [Tephrocybe rancida]|nr:hypothetical protein DXG01_010614 [Tephrocybe rancida]